MRKINKIIVHCSATAEGKDFTVADITRWHKAQGWKTIGYHWVVYRDGSVHAGRSEAEAGAHCSGQNANSIGVCYIGGVAADGKTPKDTRTEAQKSGLRQLIEKLKRKYPGASVYGHRDFAAKACPSFDAKAEYRELTLAEQGRNAGNKQGAGATGRALTHAARGLKGTGKTMGVVIPLVVLMAVLCGCATGKSFVVAETVRTDTLRMTSHHADTLLYRDTIRTDTRRYGDTVYVTQQITRWRTRNSVRTDTVYRNRRDTVVSEKLLNNLAKLQEENASLSEKLNQSREEARKSKEEARKKQLMLGMASIGAVAGIAAFTLFHKKEKS